MNTRRRIERLEAAHSTPREPSPELELYFRVLESHRRGEEPYEPGLDGDPKLCAYLERIKPPE